MNHNNDNGMHFNNEIVAIAVAQEELVFRHIAQKIRQRTVFSSTSFPERYAVFYKNLKYFLFFNGLGLHAIPPFLLFLYLL
ncbi:MAG: hypothetical protein G01um101470_687 [Parcubacteria group bacterium Gr01-1014_70]|nr:MAG: hypothetical protein G01um101470_687 [Parcubacteria group bacterium Gr01-1014_70]